MSATVEKLSQVKSKITITVDADTFEKSMEKAFRKTMKRYNIPGFRKGHAPRALVERYYGPGVLYEDAFEIAFPDAYEKALEETGLKPISRPELDVEQIEKGKDLIFTAIVYEYPEVQLGDYKSIHAEKVVDEVTDDDVNAEIERERDRIARYVDVTDRPVKLDDEVNIDYKGFCEGEQFEGGTAEGQTLVIGSGHFIPGFEDQLVGKNIGDEVEVNVTFPEEYHAENLKGKPATFQVKINSIRVKELPALDDEFAKDVSDCDTLEEYKASVRKRLEEAAENRAERAFENEVIEKLTEMAEVEIPEPMVEDEITSMLRDMEQRMMYQGMRLEDFLKYTGQTLEQMREMYREQAQERVHTRLALEALKKAEGIEATEADVDAELQMVADAQNKTLDEIKEKLSDDVKEYYKLVAEMNKTLDALKGYAVASAPESEAPAEEAEESAKPAGE